MNGMVKSGLQKLGVNGLEGEFKAASFWKFWFQTHIFEI